MPNHMTKGYDRLCGRECQYCIDVLAHFKQVVKDRSVNLYYVKVRQ